MKDRAEKALQAMPAKLRTLPREEVPLKGHNIVGVQALRSLLDDSEDTHGNGQSLTVPIVDAPSLQTLVDGLANKKKGLILFMGKGGVGKTTLAAAVAMDLVRRGYPVHLSTTDPAAHLASTVADGIDGLTISRVNPRDETQRYIDHVLASKGAHLDEEGRALLEEDLRSPCTEEVAVFHAFSRLVREAARGFVVLDTAPTGHTMLLLDATGGYHRDVIRNSHLPQGKMITPLMRLQDPDYTKLFIVTLAETTPVLEAAELQADLGRAGIEPYAWVINQSMAAARPSDPLLIQRAHAELRQIAEVRDYASRIALVPWLPEEPIGAASLQALMQTSDALDHHN
jgi:arsenite-transporting ATPase